MNNALLKCLLGFLLISLITGCNQTKEPVELQGVNVEVALKRALLESDYRLLVTSSRRVYAPGVIAEEQSKLLTLCGSKFVSGTGDVIKTEQAREQRKQQVLFMTNYNKNMAIHCQIEMK